MTDDDFRRALLLEQFGTPTPEYHPTERERGLAADRHLLASSPTRDLTPASAGERVTE